MFSYTNSLFWFFGRKSWLGNLITRPCIVVTVLFHFLTFSKASTVPERNCCQFSSKINSIDFIIKKWSDRYDHIKFKNKLNIRTRKTTHNSQNTTITKISIMFFGLWWCFLNMYYNIEGIEIENMWGYI